MRGYWTSLAKKQQEKNNQQTTTKQENSENSENSENTSISDIRGIGPKVSEVFVFDDSPNLVESQSASRRNVPEHSISNNTGQISRSLKSETRLPGSLQIELE